MHDVLEGGLQYEIKEMLRVFTQVKKYFSLHTLNKLFVILNMATQIARISLQKSLWHQQTMLLARKVYIFLITN